MNKHKIRSLRLYEETFESDVYKIRAGKVESLDQRENAITHERIILNL